MKTLEELNAKWMKDPKFVAEYHALDFTYNLINAVIDQRIKKGLTQKEVAKKIGTMQSAIARFESGKHNATLTFVQKLADELGVTITVKA